MGIYSTCGIPCCEGRKRFDVKKDAPSYTKEAPSGASDISYYLIILE